MLSPGEEKLWQQSVEELKEEGRDYEDSQEYVEYLVDLLFIFKAQEHDDN